MILINYGVELVAIILNKKIKKIKNIAKKWLNLVIKIIIKIIASAIFELRLSIYLIFNFRIKAVLFSKINILSRSALALILIIYVINITYLTPLFGVINNHFFYTLYMTGIIYFIFIYII